jgi:hypothetical protein
MAYAAPPIARAIKIKKNLHSPTSALFRALILTVVSFHA